MDLDQAFHIERRRRRVPRPLRDRRRGGVRPARRTDGRRGAPSGARRSTRPTRTSASTRPSSPRAPRACCPTRRVPRSSGRWTSTRPARASTSTSAARSSAAARSSTTSSAQQALDGGTAEEQLRLLREVGILRLQREDRRGGVSLPIPEQVITEDDGAVRAQLPRPAPRRGVERPDLPDDGHGRGGADARAAASASSAPSRPPTPTASTPPADGEGAARGVAGGDDLPVVRPEPQPGHRAASGASGGGDDPPSRLGLRRVRRRAARGSRALRARLRLHAHDGAAPPARRSLRRRGLHRAVERAEIPEWARAELPRSRRRWRSRPAGPASTRRGSSRSSRPRSSRRCRRRLRRDRRRARRAPRRDHRDPQPRSIRARCRGDDLPLGGRIKARLQEVNVMQRLVRFEKV